MTNYEKHKEWFDEHELDFKYCGERLSVNKYTHEPDFCSKLSCTACELEWSCHDNGREKWLRAEAEEEKIDWSKVEKDTLIEVDLSGGELVWLKRYFAYFCPEEQTVYFYIDGATSKTSITTCCVLQEHARLYVDD